jgi:TRAP-type C4-dicarboxylate transport system permease small subunit
MSSNWERAGGRLMAGVGALLGVAMLLNVALNFANVIGRYVFLSPIIWAEEVMGYLMVWCVFLGAALVTWDGEHLKVDSLSQKLPQRWRQFLNAVVALSIVIVSVFVLWQSWRVVHMLGSFGQKSVIASIPMVIPHAAVPVGFALIVVAVALRFRAHVIGRYEQ